MRVTEIFSMGRDEHHEHDHGHDKHDHDHGWGWGWGWGWGGWSWGGWSWGGWGNGWGGWGKEAPGPNRGGRTLAPCSQGQASLPRTALMRDVFQRG